MNAFRSNGAASRMDFLPPERRGRPASARAVTKRSDIVDAEFETVVSPGRRHVYPVFNDNRARPAAEPSGSARSVASVCGWAVNHVERLLQTASPKAFAVLVTCLCAPVFVLFASLPQYQPAIPPAPALSISDVTTSLNDANGMKILSVYGAVENHSDAPKAVPAILVDVIANGHRRPATRIDASETVLAPGESRPFSTRLLHTGGKLPGVAVSFGQPGDSAP
ncbi:hypothetical protein [Rhizobium sp. Root483D2]|uniref:hypothetical protein n=1 Tax=Rhizobium sp. Root483D2 TaxID=1736545 RepID=UPI0007123177|nr:hypothetical protein [Rhizobium sp. Root483D2]KQY34171.1 hypothetical protein ASD32_23350 [Rhizobium sp. Root483D2]